MNVTRLITVMLLALFAFGGEGKKEQSDSAKGGPLTLPKEAVAIEPHTWRHKDTAGKTWIYRQTPFGLVRFPEEKTAAAGPEKASSQAGIVSAVEDGDEVRFERQGPFGPYRWVRKKTELTAEERQAWERAQKEAAEKKKPSKE
jgi:hypothetical protein